MPPTGDLTRHPGMCPEGESNRQPLSLQAGTQSTEPHQPGPLMGFKQEIGMAWFFFLFLYFFLLSLSLSLSLEGHSGLKPTKSTTKNPTLKQITDYRKVAGYGVIDFLYTSNEQLEFEIKNTILLT